MPHLNPADRTAPLETLGIVTSHQLAAEWMRPPTSASLEERERLLRCLAVETQSLRELHRDISAEQ